MLLGFHSFLCDLDINSSSAVSVLVVCGSACALSADNAHITSFKSHVKVCHYPAVTAANFMAEASFVDMIIWLCLLFTCTANCMVETSFVDMIIWLRLLFTCMATMSKTICLTIQALNYKVYKCVNPLPTVICTCTCSVQVVPCDICTFNIV